MNKILHFDPKQELHKDDEQNEEEEEDIQTAGHEKQGEEGSSRPSSWVNGQNVLNMTGKRRKFEQGEGGGGFVKKSKPKVLRSAINNQPRNPDDSKLG